MQSAFVHGVQSLDRAGQHTLVAIGNFDGVHRGHRAVLERAVQRAHTQGLLPIVLTFFPRPAEVLGFAAPPLLTTLPRKALLLRHVATELGVVVQPFDHAFARQSPTQFARELLHEGLAARAVVVGQNFRFGHQRAGNFTTLQELGQRLGFEVIAEPVLGDPKGPWSSTRIRNALQAGDLDDANATLGRPHTLEGIVVPGLQKGRTLGFPTANLSAIEEALPAFGVYAVGVEGVEHPGMEGVPLAGGVASFGVRPTVANAGFAAEVHLFDRCDDLYGQRLRVHLLKRLREERRFSSLESLQQQMIKDAQEARQVVSRWQAPPTIDLTPTNPLVPS